MLGSGVPVLDAWQVDREAGFYTNEMLAKPGLGWEGEGGSNDKEQQAPHPALA